MKQHNYVRKVEQFIKTHGIEPGKLNEVMVYHDEWCGIHGGRRCNCNPVVKRYARKANAKGQA